MKNTPKNWHYLATAILAIVLQNSVAPHAFGTDTPAIESNAFVVSTAVATHWRFNNVYTRYSELSDKLIDSGIHYGRDTGTGRDFIAKAQKLAGAGVKSIITISPLAGIRPNSSYWAGSPGYAINDYARLIGTNTIAYAEMNNELDMASQQAATYWHNTSEPISGDPASDYYYAKYLQAATPDTWAQLAGDSDPGIYSLPLIGPSLTSDSAYSAVGDLTSGIEYSNVHHYFYGWNPETSNVRGIDHAVTYQSLVQSPTQPMASTEGGESSAASITASWPLFAHGRYVPRHYLSHFVKGFKITTMYELVDEGTDPANKENNFGLLKNDLSEKPAFTALKNVLSVLKDPGDTFSPAALDYTLSGSTTNVWSTLFQKRNGDYYLCLWLGLPCYNPQTGATITVAAQTVSIALPASIANAQIFTLDDTGAMTSTAGTITSNVLSLDVTDRITLVRLSTVSTGGAASTPAGLRAVPTDGQISLKWAPVFEATSYTLKRATTSGGTFSTVASGLISPAYNDASLTNGTIYYYVVSATNAGGESANSTPISAVPAASVIVDNADGTGVGITGSWTTSTSTAGYYATNFLHDGNTGSTGGKSVRLTPTLALAGSYDVHARWPAAGNRATNAPIDVVSTEGTYTVRMNQQVNGGAWVLLGTFNFNAGTTGYVVVRNDSANGYVVADAVRFDLTIPRAPMGLITSPDAGQIGLSWTASPGAISYSVKRSLSPQGAFTLIASGITTTSYTDTSVVDYTPYYYAISATNAGGESMDSSPVCDSTGTTLIVDNADSTGVVKTGTWTTSSSSPGYYGANYLHDSNTGSTGGKKVTFTPTIATTGNYKVYLRWTADTNRANNTPVDITHAAGITTLSVNQRVNNGVWVLLGTFNFTSGSGNIAVRNDAANGFVIADAVKIVLQ